MTARTGLIVAIAISLGGAALSYGQAVDTGRPADGPRYAASGELVRPTDYRDWVYLSSGLNMTYGANPRSAATNLPFNNVFVNRPAYRSFVDTGKWPEQTIFVLEIRRSEQHVRPDNFGYTQGGISFIEAAVKDSEKNGANPWAYYSFDSASGLTATAKPQPATGSCQQCHAQHTAVEQTFVQFYPTLFDVAKAKGTVKSTWNGAR
jgi:hypothetical protein